MPLSDVAIKNAKPADKPRKLADGGGLYLEVAPSGGKWWRLKYRYGGKEKRLSLGVYPEVSLKEARERREAARKLLAEGDDPGQARKAERAATARAALQTFEAVATAWLNHRSTAWTADTKEGIAASLRSHVYPELADKPIGDVTPADVRKVVTAIDKAGAGETAGRVFQRVRAVFRYAIAHDLVSVDPTYPLKPGEIFKPREVRHRAALHEQDVSLFFARLADYAAEGSTREALELLALTAVRPGELRGARWDEIDLQAAMWSIPAERMKMKAPHRIPLSSQALALLARLPREDEQELLFPSPYYPGKPLSENTFNSAMARLGYKGQATAHGFRTLFSTAANEAGWAPDVIEAQLAHRDRNEVRAAYNRAQWMADRTRLMQWWADRLDALRKGADVIPIRAA